MRVWLSDWEWACCGDPFVPGDAITLHVDPPADIAWLHAHIGTELTAMIDAVETHHEEPGATAVHGTVRAISGVAVDRVRRWVPRERPPPSPPPLTGAGFIAIRAGGDPGGTWTEDPVPGSARLVPVPRVPWPRRFGELDDTASDQEGPAEDDDAVPRVIGYLVEIHPD